MMNKPLFGPAGNSDSFTKAYKGSVHAPKWLKELGLDCYEYQCGRGVNIGEDTARSIGAQAAEQGIDGVIAEIRTAVIEGNSWYYFRLIGENHYYAVSAAQCETAVILNKGDKVTILDAAQEGDIRTAGSIRLS